MSSGNIAKIAAYGIGGLVLCAGLIAVVGKYIGEEVPIFLNIAISAGISAIVGGVIYFLRGSSTPKQATPVRPVMASGAAPSTKPKDDERVQQLLTEGMDQDRSIGEQTAFFRGVKSLALEEELARQAAEQKKGKPVNRPKRAQEDDIEPIKMD